MNKKMRNSNVTRVEENDDGEHDDVETARMSLQQQQQQESRRQQQQQQQNHRHRSYGSINSSTAAEAALRAAQAIITSEADGGSSISASSIPSTAATSVGGSCNTSFSSEMHNEDCWSSGRTTNRTMSDDYDDPYDDAYDKVNKGSNNRTNDNSNPLEEEEEPCSYYRWSSEGRLRVLACLTFLPMGVKFFKSALSCFQPYWMDDQLLPDFNATNYGLMLALISFPAFPIIGGYIVDSYNRNRHASSYAAIGFLFWSLLGMVVTGTGLEVWHSLPVAFAGAALFGSGEKCVMIAARTLVGHAFWNDGAADGALAQGVLVAMDSLTMMVSKAFVPWFIEQHAYNGELTAAASSAAAAATSESEVSITHQHYLRSDQDYLYEDDDLVVVVGGDGNPQRTGVEMAILACCAVQCLSLAAGVVYAFGFRWAHRQLPRHHRGHNHEPSYNNSTKSLSSERRGLLVLEVESDDGDEDYPRTSGGAGFALAQVLDLPMTFWVVSIWRAIFLVVFKVFSQFSNSFLMEQFEVGSVQAGRISCLHEVFALFSPVVGYLAYRSPSGIFNVALGAAALGSLSLALLALFTAFIEELPGGPVGPVICVSIAHGVIIPISIAMIPQTVPPAQLGMAFAVFEVLGSMLHLTDIVFGWLRDVTGSYNVPMEMLFIYSLAGTGLLWFSRDRIRLPTP